MEALAELETVQTRILHRISDLELSHLPQSFSHSLSLSLSTTAADADASTTTECRLSAILRANAFSFKRVPSDYYDWTLKARRDILGAASIHHLCKSIALENLQALCLSETLPDADTSRTLDSDC